MSGEASSTSLRRAHVSSGPVCGTGVAVGLSQGKPSGWLVTKADLATAGMGAARLARSPSGRACCLSQAGMPSRNCT